MPIFCVKSVKIYTRQKKFTREFSWLSWQIWGMHLPKLTKTERLYFFLHFKKWNKWGPPPADDDDGSAEEYGNDDDNDDDDDDIWKVATKECNTSGPATAQYLFPHNKKFRWKSKLCSQYRGNVVFQWYSISCCCTHPVPGGMLVSVLRVVIYFPKRWES